MTSYLVKQTQCPQCAKLGKDKRGDNLAVYSDGHEWCYSCGYYLSSNGVAKFLSEQENNNEKATNIYLPYDSTYNYPIKALRWIEQYELTKNDLQKHNVVWSDKLQRLIFPVFGNEGLIAWQGRWFGEGEAVKWFGRGNLKDTFNIIFNRNDRPLVLTEDVISAIKVSRWTSAMPLYGSHIDAYRWKSLLHNLGYRSKVVIWLDKDKQKEAIKFSRQGNLMGLDVSVIITDLDPKELSYEEIKKILDKQ